MGEGGGCGCGKIKGNEKSPRFFALFDYVDVLQWFNGLPWGLLDELGVDEVCCLTAYPGGAFL